MARTGVAENSAANKTDAANAAAANARTTAATDKYNTDFDTLKAGKNIGIDPFSTSTYLSNLNRDFATTADATANAGNAQIADTALRTGDNSASYTEAIKNNSRNAQRTANSGLNAVHSADYGRNLDWQQALLQSDLAPAGISQSQYATSIGGQNAALGNLTQFGLASYAPWTAAIGAAGAAAGGAMANPNFIGSKPPSGGTSTGCWIAEAIYGVDDPRTHLVRAWLNTEFIKTSIGRAVMAAYLKSGQGIAKMVRKSRFLKMALKPLFDRALQEAELWANRPVRGQRNWWDACHRLLVRGDEREVAIEN